MADKFSLEDYGTTREGRRRRAMVQDTLNRLGVREYDVTGDGTLEKLKDKIVAAHESGDLESAKVLADYGNRIKMAQKAIMDAPNPTDGMSTFDKTAAGIGAAFRGNRLGVEQRLGLRTPQEIDEFNKLNAPLMNTTAGSIGNSVGNAVPALVAAMATPGKFLAQAATGAVVGAMVPTGSNDSVGANMLMGGVFGGAPMALGNTVGKAMDYGRKFTNSGRQTLAEKGIVSALENPSDPSGANLVQALRNIPKPVDGFIPTSAMASREAINPALAQTERVISASNKNFFGPSEENNRQAIVRSLRSVSRPDDLAPAIANRSAITDPLYTAADKATAQLTPELEALLNTPTAQAAISRAGNLSKDEMRPFNYTPASTTNTGFDPLMTGNPQLQTNPRSISGKAIQDIKSGIDSQIGNNINGIQGAERRAAIGLRGKINDWGSQNIEPYNVANTTYGDMSKPINQMQVGQAFENAMVKPGEFGQPIGFNADMAQKILRDPKRAASLVENATGRDMPLTSAMEPAQIQAMRNSADAASLINNSRNYGLGSSPTFDSMGGNAVIDNGLHFLPGGSVVSSLLKAGEGSRDAAIRQKMAELLANPKQLAAAIESQNTPSLWQQMYGPKIMGALRTSLPADLANQIERPDNN